MSGPAEAVLIVTEASADWRHRAGPVVYTTFTGLALSAVADGDGWFAPVGVRDLARAVGLNKDTAARAVAALAAMGVVRRERAVTPGGASRSGYRLALPDGISLLCPASSDTDLCRTGTDTRPLAVPDDDGCPAASDALRREASACVRPGSSDTTDLVAHGRSRVSARRVDETAEFERDVVEGGLAERDRVERRALSHADERQSALNLPVSAALGVARRDGTPGRRAAQDEAQGHLFDLAVVVTGGSEDQRR